MEHDAYACWTRCGQVLNAFSIGTVERWTSISIRVKEMERVEN
jgi:hypothetical protein